jgi:hypothetical protein
VTLTAVSLQDTLESDFAVACAHLAQAKLSVRVKDTPAARARVDECARRVDARLDMSNGLPWDRD